MLLFFLLLQQLMIAVIGFSPRVKKAVKVSSRQLTPIDALLTEPSARFAAVSVLTLSGLFSKITQSPLRKERQVKPANMTGLEWRENQVAMWNLRPGDGFCAKYFVREWARRPLIRNAHIEDLDAGVRIRWGARGKYLSAQEERALEKKWLETQSFSHMPLPLADSSYSYPKRATRTDAGGIDLVVIGDSVSAFRSSYAPNEPIKQASERRLISALDLDLSIAYSAVRVQSSF